MQSDIGSVCHSHLEFMKWADEVTLTAVLQQPADKVSADMASSFKSMLDTLTHIYLAELVWLKRVQGEGSAQLANLPRPAGSTALAQAWPTVHRMWLEWADSFDSEGWNKPCTMRNSAGVESSLPYWQIVLHLANHGSYHRGQAATMLRQTGVVPPGTDLATFYRNNAAAAQH